MLIIKATPPPNSDRNDLCLLQKLWQQQQQQQQQNIRTKMFHMFHMFFKILYIKSQKDSGILTILLHDISEQTIVG